MIFSIIVYNRPCVGVEVLYLYYQTLLKNNIYSVSHSIIRLLATEHSNKLVNRKKTHSRKVARGKLLQLLPPPPVKKCLCSLLPRKTEALSFNLLLPVIVCMEPLAFVNCSCVFQRDSFFLSLSLILYCISSV